MLTPETGGLLLPEPDFGPPPLPPGFPRWKVFGWDSWEVDIPVDWDLAAIETTPKGGYYRLDDEFEPRLMVRWQHLTGRFDAEEAIKGYLKKQGKALARSGKRMDSRIGANLPGISRAFKGLDYQTYSLSVDGRYSVGVSALCPRCDRAFAAEISAERSPAGDRLISRVLGSLRDHPEGNEARWEVYGVSADLPSTLRAAGRSFRQGLMSFSVEESGRRVDIARWTLAATLLAGKADLRSFLVAHLEKTRGLPRLNMEPAVVMSHQACAFHTYTRTLESARQRLRRALRLHAPAHISGLIWHCQTSNRIFMLTLATNRHRDLAEARLLASRIRCCKVMY